MVKTFLSTIYNAKRFVNRKSRVCLTATDLNNLMLLEMNADDICPSSLCKAELCWEKLQSEWEDNFLAEGMVLRMNHRETVSMIYRQMEFSVMEAIPEQLNGLVTMEVSYRLQVFLPFEHFIMVVSVVQNYNAVGIRGTMVPCLHRDMFSVGIQEDGGDMDIESTSEQEPFRVNAFTQSEVDDLADRFGLFLTEVEEEDFKLLNSQFKSRPVEVNIPFDSQLSSSSMKSEMLQLVPGDLIVCSVLGVRLKMSSIVCVARFERKLSLADSAVDSCGDVKLHS